jgi:tetratricopeptide (TPR) repeat protein
VSFSAIPQTSVAFPSRMWILLRDESIAFLGKRTAIDDQAALNELAELLGDLPLALEEATAYLEETQDDLDEYLELVQDRSRELFGLDQPPEDERGDQRRVATVWSLSLDRVHQEAPEAEALLSLCAFLAPDIPRGLPRELPQLLPEELAQVVSDTLAYNRMLAVVGRYSLAMVSPMAVGLHRLVQAVIQARLGEKEERHWANIAVGLLRAIFPNDSWEVPTWPKCERLLPQVLTATGHAERLAVSQEAAGWLLDRASIYLRRRGQYRQARPIAERALAVTEEILGQDDPEVAWRCNNLGGVLQDLGELEGARAQLERTLAIGEAALGLHHPSVAAWRGSLSEVLQAVGDLPRAKAQLERALMTGEETLGPDHPNVADYRSHLGRVLQDLGELEGAREQLERALAIGEAVRGPDHPDVANYCNNLGHVLQALGELEGAREQLERALAIGEAALGPDHPTVATIRGNLNSVLATLRKPPPEGRSLAL